MPNRVLRDWTASEIVDALDVHAERFFVRLIMKVDDYGRFSSNVRLLNSTLFPLRSDIRDTDITRWLAACEKAGMITVYTVASKSYLQIENFNQQLRQKTTKYPPPNECLADDTHMHSKGLAIASLKRNETETRNEIEKESVSVVPTQPKLKSFKFFSKEDFKSSITENASGFEKDMLNKFYSYWTEPSPSGKMRFQLEKTWETGRRLANWKSREKSSGATVSSDGVTIKRKKL